MKLNQRGRKISKYVRDVREHYLISPSVHHTGIKRVSDICHVFDRTGPRPTELIEKEALFFAILHKCALMTTFVILQWNFTLEFILFWPSNIKCILHLMSHECPYRGSSRQVKWAKDVNVMKSFLTVVLGLKMEFNLDVFFYVWVF